jgi:undecaprenyl-diphosphatase
MFIWAILVAYSRIYMGVHYPGDVIVGAAVGILIGIVLGTVANRILRQSI